MACGPRRMRLLFFDFTINFGGGPQGSLYLCRRLNVDHEVHVVDAYGTCREYCEAVRAAGLPLHILYPKAQDTYIGAKDKPVKRFLRAATQIPDFLRIRHRLIRTVVDIRPDAIWVNNEKSLAFLVSSRALRRVPTAMYVRGWATPDQVSPFLCWLMKKYLAAIIAHARASIEQLKKRGIPESKLFYTPNTICVEEVVRRATTTPAVCEPQDPRVKLLLPAARFQPAKGQDTAVRALRRLEDQGVDAVLWLPGKIGTGEDPGFRQEVLHLADDLGVRERVRLLGWQDNMPALMQACDVVVLPTHTEGFPRSILEAMLLKKPVCATPVGGIPEAIQHGSTGYLFEIGDAEGLAEAVRQVVTDPEATRALCRRAYELFQEHHRPEQHTQAIVRMFEHICPSAPRKPS